MDIDWWTPSITTLNFEEAQQEVYCLNLSSIHPILSGNKFYKITGYIQQYQQGPYDCIVSMGGAHSNHLHALAYYCFEKNIPFYAFIRTDHSPSINTPTLVDLKEWNTMIVPCSSSVFRKLRNTDEFEDFLPYKIKNGLWIPEGGRGGQGQYGLKKLFQHLMAPYDTIFLNVGTGTTLLSLLTLEDSKNKKIIGVAPFKKVEEQIKYVQSQLVLERDFKILSDPWNLGFGKINFEIVHYVDSVQKKLGIDLDYVYTSRLFYALEKWLKEGNNLENAKILIIHGGGLQGNRAFKQKNNLL